MSQQHASLNDIFNVAESAIAPVEILPPATITASNNDAQEDFEYARQNLKDIIEKGQDALETVFELAKTSESPRAFEVASQMVKTLTDANKDLLELRKKNKEITGEGAQPSTPHTVNNHLFVGSTAELQQLIKKNKELK